MEGLDSLRSRPPAGGLNLTCEVAEHADLVMQVSGSRKSFGGMSSVVLEFRVGGSRQGPRYHEGGSASMLRKRILISARSSLRSNETIRELLARSRESV